MMFIVSDLVPVTYMKPDSSVEIPDGFCTTLHVHSGSSDGDREYLLSFPPLKSETSTPSEVR